MRLPQLRAALVEAARRQERGARRPLYVRRRPLVLIVVLVLGGATAALAASGVFRTGAPLPPSSTPQASLLVGGRWKLLSVRAPDPSGGPAWAIRLVYYRKGWPFHQATLCAQFGRIVDGRFGLLGQDGLFGDDHLFHPADIASYADDGCYGGIASGLNPTSLEFTSGSQEGVASGATEGLLGCSQVNVRSHTPPAVEALYRRRERQLEATIALLRAGGPAARALARPYDVSVAKLVTADEGWLRIGQAVVANKPLKQWTLATCPAGSLRTIYYGFAGPKARSMTLRGHGVNETERVNPADAGAYLFVLPGVTGWYGEQTRVTCLDGSHRWGCVAGRQPVCVPDQRPSNGPSQASPGRAALSILAVLREPPTPANTLPADRHNVLPSGIGRVLVNYIRRARTAFGGTYYLVPTIVTNCKPEAPTERISTVELFKNGSSSGGGPSIADIAAGDGIDGSQSAPIPGSPFVSTTKSIVEEIVPDGVATVTLHFPAVATKSPAVTITATPVNNLMLAEVPIGPGSRPIQQATITWRTANGTIIKTIHGTR
jgi:hypothetical protein